MKSLFTVLLALALAVPVVAQEKQNPCNPCAKKKSEMKQNPCNPCAKKASSQMSASGDDVAITGEIIDLKCFTSGMMGGRGPEHEECAIACIQGGLPVGIIDDKGDVYTVVPAKGTKGANETLAKYAAKRVTLKGKIIEKGGARLIHYASLETAK
ncbi:MAG: hypothetical protein WEB62_05180 [Bacteroidota bacterium]